MDCKNCGAQLDEGVTMCPACGQQNEQLPEEAAVETVAEQIAVETVAEQIAEETVETEMEAPVEEVTQPAKKKTSIWLILLAAIGAVAILGVLVWAVLYGFGIDLKPRENNAMYKDSYTVSDDKAIKKADTVIATVGDQELTNSKLQVYYWSAVKDFLNNYGYYLSSMGLDYTKPLSSQIYNEETGMTWEQFFIENAINTWHRYAALNLQAQEEKFPIGEELQKMLEGLPAEVEKIAAENKSESADKLIAGEFGAAATVKDYVSYMTDYYVGLEFYNDHYESFVPTDDEIEKYYNDNLEALSASGITKEAGKYYDVRHILLTPEGGTKNEDGSTTYTDEAWAKCLTEAQALLDSWKNGEATEDSFAKLAKEKSKDSGSSENGGLYSQLTKTTSFVEEFKNWYLDESRKVGDTGIVKTIHGYHIMYFSGSSEIWSVNVRNQIVQERTNEMVENALAKFPVTINFKKIVLASVTL